MSQSDQQVDGSKRQRTVESDERNSSDGGQQVEDDRLAAFTGRMLDHGDTVIYSIVGVCFFLVGLVALGYSFWNFAYQLRIASTINPLIVIGALVQLISDLLLVVIVMEVLGTIVHYLKSHVTSLRPFLFIGIISATRSILLIGAKLTVGSDINQGVSFSSDMIELGVSAGVILALGITIKLLGNMVDFNKP
jgi:uncharacterized membrane protein (DUF373 family)